MFSSPKIFLAGMLAAAGCFDITDATASPLLSPIVFEVPGGKHGYNALNSNGDHISYGTLGGMPGKVVNGVFTPFSVPPGYTNLSATHPSQDGTLAVFIGSCGGTVCSVVYGDGEPKLFPGFQLFQVGNGGELAGTNAGGQPVRLSLSNPTPVILSTGVNGGATIFAQSTNGVAVGTTYGSDGSGKAAVWDSSGVLTILNSITSEVGILGISSLGKFAVGTDGGFASIWNLMTGVQTLISKLGGGFQEGTGLTVLDDGSASGNNWIYASADGYSMTACAFLGNPSSIAACQPGAAGINRITLAQNGEYVGIGGQASIFQTTVSLTRFTGENSTDVPEVGTTYMLLLAMAGLYLTIKRNESLLFALRNQ